MTIPSWPADLPQNILAQGFKGGLPNNQIRTNMDVGPAQVRRRGTVAVEPVTGNILCTPTELALFKTFYETTLLDGSLRFKWKDPLVDDDITTTLIASLSGVTANLSLVDGLSFISNPSTDLSDYEYTKVIVTDSAGKKAIGYIKAAGTGETWGPEMVSDPTFDNAAHWTAGASWSVAGGVATCAGGSGGNLQNTSGTALGAKRLYKAVFEITTQTNGSVRPRYPQIGIGASTVAAHTQYICNADTTGEKPLLQSVTEMFIGSVTSFSVKQVLTPSATGVTITSTPGGSVYNWASVESGFNFNGTSYDIDLYATEMRFVEPPTWNWVDGYFEVVLPLEILK